MTRLEPTGSHKLRNSRNFSKPEPSSMMLSPEKLSRGWTKVPMSTPCVRRLDLAFVVSLLWKVFSDTVLVKVWQLGLPRLNLHAIGLDCWRCTVRWRSLSVVINTRCLSGRSTNLSGSFLPIECRLWKALCRIGDWVGRSLLSCTMLEPTGCFAFHTKV